MGKTKLKCFSLGVQGDVGWEFATGGAEVGLGIGLTHPGASGYIGGSLGVGVVYNLDSGTNSAPSGGAGFEIGFWTVKPKDMKGESVVFALGFAQAKQPGAEVQVIFDFTNWKFLGAQLTFPNFGSEIEASVSFASTETF